MGKPLVNEDLAVRCSACSLAELCLPRGLSEADTELLSAIVRHKKAAHKGDQLYRSGQTDESLYAVRSGGFKTVLRTNTGEEQILAFHLPGELFGFDSMANGKHACEAIALEASSVCSIPIHDLEAVYAKVPALHQQLRAFVGREINVDHAMLLMLSKKNAEEKLAAFLLSVSSRFKRRGFSPLAFTLAMSRQDIANYLGLTVETVSRTFTRFQKAGVLSAERKDIRIHSIEFLKENAGGCLGALTME